MKRNSTLGERASRLRAALLRGALPAAVLSAAVLVSLPGCTKEGAETWGNGRGAAAVTKGTTPIALRPTLRFSPFEATRGITKPTPSDATLPKSYAIYTSAYYTDPEFPETDGNYFTGATFTYNALKDTWQSATTDTLYWPATGHGNGMDFLAVATDTTVYKLSGGSACLWAGQDDRFMHGERNVYGVRMQVPYSADSTEILYALASQECSDKDPVELEFHHTQCCLEFRIHANLDSVIRLNEIVVQDAYTTGELTIVTHPLVNVTWNMEGEEQHGAEVPGVEEETPVTVHDTLKYGMVLPPQPRRDITFHFHQSPVNMDLSDPYVQAMMAADPSFAMMWQAYAVNPVYTTTSEALKWEAGKKYIFDVTIKFGEIIVVPYVVDWTDGDDIIIPV